MRIRVVVWMTLVLTIILLAVSITFFVYRWYLINGLSITVSAFMTPVFSIPILTIVNVNPCGVVFSILFFGQHFYPTSPTKFILDLLFLIPYTLAFLVTGPICFLVSPLSEIAGYEKFSDAVNKVRSIATKGTRKQRVLIIGGSLTTLVLYMYVVFSLFTESPIVSNPIDPVFRAIVIGGAGLISAGLGLTGAMGLKKIRKTAEY